MRQKNLNTNGVDTTQLKTERPVRALIYQAILAIAFAWLAVATPHVAATQISDGFAFDFQDSLLSKGKKVAVEVQDPNWASDVKSWRIQISNTLLKSKPGDKLNIPLPNGEVITVILSTRRHLSNGDIQLIGEYEGDGRMLLTLNETTVFGSIIDQQRNLIISQVNKVGQILVDRSSLDGGAIDLGEDQVFPDTFTSKNLQQSLKSSGFTSIQAANQGGLSEVDILIAYSSEFRSLFSSPTTRINQLIGFSNDAFARSGILLRLRLVQAVEIPFNNNASTGAILNAATDGTGDFTQLHALRNQYGADLVAILPGVAGFSASGIAWVNGSNESVGYSVTRLSPGCCDSVFTHEVGHNLGSGHERQSSNPNQGSPCRGGVTGFACGYGKSASGWGTLMSYLNAGNVGYRFSSLSFDCLGQVCGIAQGQANAADNRTSFNLSRIQVAKFRNTIIPSPTTPPRTPPRTNTIEWLPPILDVIIE